MILPTTTFGATLRTPIPQSVSQESAIRLLHDHAAHIRLDPLVLSSSRIGKERASGPAGHRTSNGAAQYEWEDLGVRDGVSEWLRTATRRVAEEVHAEGISNGGAVEADYWGIGIGHPLGRWMGELRYNAGFIDTANGSRVVVEVPGSFGMRIWSRYTIQRDTQDSRTGQGQRLCFSEEDWSECAWGLGKFVKKEHEKAHNIIHRSFIESLAKGRI